MRKLFKWISLLGGIILLIALALAGLVYLLFLWTIPADNGQQQIAGLASEVSVVRDGEGIPHIEAKDRLDAARALGFVHAQDRLWQMHVLRMAGQGRLSELFGSATIDTDRFIKTLDIAGHAEKSVSALKSDTVSYLTAYADGVNAYLNRDVRRFQPKLPPEFLILGGSPEAWKPWHSLVILKVMDLTLGANMDAEIKRLALASRGFSPLEIDDILPAGPLDNPPALPDLREIFGIGTNIDKLKSDINSPNRFADLEIATGLTASNNWVISGDRTTSGKPILANDPHLGFTAPAVFYLAHLKYEIDGAAHNIIGGTLPGVPAFLVGRNDRVAWGLTTTYLDAQDIFIERLDPDKPDHYLTPGGSKPFETSEVRIKVSGGEDVVFERRVSRHGPVLPGSYRDLENIVPLKHVAAVQWTALTDQDTSMDAVSAIGEAKNVGEFIEAFKPHVSPMQSVVVADIDGNIGLIAPGKVPVRSAQNQIAGRAPVPGWLAEYDWQGFLEFDQLPIYQNPSAGALATANAKWLPNDYPYHITFDWSEHFRQQLVNDLIVGRNEPHDINSSKAAMGSDYSAALQKFRDFALSTMPAGVTFDPELMAALKAWDGRMDQNRPEPLVVMSWFKYLHNHVFSDDLDETYKLFDRGNLTALLNVMENAGARNWCDDRSTTPVEDCASALTITLDETLKELAAEYGSDWLNWRWGSAHIVLGEHRPFGRVGLLSRFFNVEVPISGGPYTLLRGQTDFGEENPMMSRHGSVYRAIYDFSDLEKSMFIQSTGQSGHFLSDHYDSFAERWSEMEFVPMTTNPETYRVGAKGTWKLTPN